MMATQLRYTDRIPLWLIFTPPSRSIWTKATYDCGPLFRLAHNTPDWWSSKYADIPNSESQCLLIPIHEHFFYSQTEKTCSMGRRKVLLNTLWAMSLAMQTLDVQPIMMTQLQPNDRIPLWYSDATTVHQLYPTIVTQLRYTDCIPLWSIQSWCLWSNLQNAVGNVTSDPGPQMSDLQQQNTNLVLVLMNPILEFS